MKSRKVTPNIDANIGLELTVYAPNITNIKEPQNYVGDLDAFIAGVCESISFADKQVKPNVIFDKEKADPLSPLLIKNDSQVVVVLAKKEQSDRTFYKIKINEIKT